MPVIPRLGRTDPGAVRAVEAAPAAKHLDQLGRTLDVVGQRMETARKSREVNEAVTEATRRILAHEDQLQENPGEFTSWVDTHAKFLEGTRKEFDKNISDPEVRDAVNERLNTLQVHSEVRIRQGARSQEIREGRAAITAMEDVLSDNYAKLPSAVDRELVIDSVDDAYERAVDDGLLTAEEAEQRRQIFINNVEKLRARTDIDKDPDLGLKMLKDGEYNLEPSDVQVLKEKADRDIQANLNARKAAIAQQQQHTWTEIFDGIDQDKMGRADIDQAYDTIDPATGMRALSEQGKRALIRFLDTHNKDKKKAAGRRAIYQQSLKDGLPLDHKTKEDREAAEQAFLDLAPNLPGRDPVETNSMIINNILRPMKIWPKSLQRQMRIAAKSGDNEFIENFANLYDRVSTDPTVAAVNVSMVDEDQAFWETIVTMRRAGVMTPENIQLARHNAYELTDDDKAALKQAYKDKKYVGGNKNTFNELVESFQPSVIDELKKWPDTNWSSIFEGAPDAPPGMVADYQNLVKQYYYLTPDIEIARKLAGEALKRAWMIEDDEEVQK